MSALAPLVPLPYPDYNADRVDDDRDVEPVPEVNPVTPVRPVDSEENRPESEAPLPPTDAAVMSNTVRTLAAQHREADLANPTPTGSRMPPVSGDPLENAARIRNNLGVRGLIQSFANYDNSAARRRYDAGLNMFVRYGPPRDLGAESDPVARLRLSEYKDYIAFGVTEGVTPNRAYREAMAESIDRWLTGQGVFTPAMLRFASTDGFRFSPLTANARGALRASDVLARYDRAQTAAYLREMGALTPSDFLFYDPTGLGALALEARRDFLSFVQRILDQRRIDQRAAELQYAFDEENRIELDRLAALRQDELRRLEDAEGEINTYYGQLLQSVRQYNAGIISDGLS